MQSYRLRCNSVGMFNAGAPENVTKQNHSQIQELSPYPYVMHTIIAPIKDNYTYFDAFIEYLLKYAFTGKSFPYSSKIKK